MVTKTNTKTNEQNKKEEVVYNYEQLLKEHKTVSAVIRFLNSKELTRSEIAKVTGKRYQHVRNVLVTPLKKES